MDENTDSSIPTRESQYEVLLDLLKSYALDKGYTVSFYTSRKQRPWVSIKTFTPVTYSVSVELDRTGDTHSMLEALLVALRVHSEAMEAGDVVQNRWICQPVPIELAADAWSYIETHRRQMQPPPPASSPATTKPTRNARRLEEIVGDLQGD